MIAATSPEVYFKHEEFDPAKSSTYQLVCSVAEHQFTTLVTNRMQKVLFLQRLLNRKRLSLEDFALDVFRTNEFMGSEFLFKQMLLFSERWILLPDKAYSVDAQADLLSIEHIVNEDQDEMVMDAIAPLSVRTLFATPKSRLNFFRNQLTQVQFRHGISQMIRQTHRMQVKTGKPLILLVEVIDYSVGIVIFREGELLFGNLYNVVNAAEVREYVLGIAAALELTPTQLCTVVAGTGELLTGISNLLADANLPLLDGAEYYLESPDLQAVGLNMQQFGHLIIPVG
jgi:Protein of unknown function (DUF3822)